MFLIFFIVKIKMFSDELNFVLFLCMFWFWFYSWFGLFVMVFRNKKKIIVIKIDNLSIVYLLLFLIGGYLEKCL